MKWRRVVAGSRSSVHGGCSGRHPDVAGLRWWSTLESSWIQVTLFDRALGSLAVERVQALAVDDPAVTAAAEHLGLV